MLNGRGTLQICSLMQVAITFDLNGFWFRSNKLIILMFVEFDVLLVSVHKNGFKISSKFSIHLLDLCLSSTFLLELFLAHI